MLPNAARAALGGAASLGKLVHPRSKKVLDLLGRLDELHAVVERIPENEPGLRRDNERYILYYTKERRK